MKVVVIEIKLSIKDSDFAFYCVHLLYYKCSKINFERGGSYEDSPDRIKNKKATLNPSTKNDSKHLNML